MEPENSPSGSSVLESGPTLTADDDRVTVRLAGELDIATLPYLWGRLGDAVKMGIESDVVVDLSEVTFIDCSALGPLMAARRGLGGRLELRGASRPVTHLLELTGLTELLVTQDPPAMELTGFARTSGFPLSEETVRSALRLVTVVAAETLPGTCGAGVTLLRDGTPSTAAASDDLVEAADALQYQLGEGPCLSALHQREAFRIHDTATEDRWPRWTESVAPLRVRAVLSTPMLVDGEAAGAIKVYSREPGAYDEPDAHVLALLAAQAAILLANVQSQESATALTHQLRAAIRSRDVIGMAKGILMVTRGIDETAAFAILVQSSRRSNLKLLDAAQRMIETRSSSPG